MRLSLYMFLKIVLSASFLQTLEENIRNILGSMYFSKVQEFPIEM